MHDEFPQDDGILYLNHAAVSPWPARTRDAVIRFADENTARGAAGYMKWIEVEAELRAKLATLINAPSVDDIALLKNTSEALSVVAHGLGWQAGDNVVFAQQEFPSNRIVWQSLESRGVEPRMIDLNIGQSPEDALLDRIDKKTRLLAVSSVQYATGLKIDLNKLGTFCRDNAILFCVDAIQSIGALQFDVQAINADFVMADGHKWMLGPEGIAVFYTTAKARDQLTLNQFGWHMVEDQYDFDQLDWHPARSARRFECGSPNMLGIHALDASLSLLVETGMESVERKLIKNTSYIIDNINNIDNFILISDEDPARRSGIVTFRHTEMGTAELYQLLTSKGIVCAPRGGGIRFSPHFYTPQTLLESTIEILNSV